MKPSTPVPAQLYCKSCTCTQYAAPLEGENIIATVARIRRAMGECCTRRGTASGGICPMRSQDIKVPGLSEFEPV